MDKQKIVNVDGHDYTLHLLSYRQVKQWSKNYIDDNTYDTTSDLVKLSLPDFNGEVDDLPYNTVRQLADHAMEYNQLGDNTKKIRSRGDLAARAMPSYRLSISHRARGKT